MTRRDIAIIGAAVRAIRRRATILCDSTKTRLVIDIVYKKA